VKGEKFPSNLEGAGGG